MQFLNNHRGDRTFREVSETGAMNGRQYVFLWLDFPGNHFAVEAMTKDAMRFDEISQHS